MREYINTIRFHPVRILFALFFAAGFTVIGYFAPLLYLQHFDVRRYIDVVEPVTFDKKVYSAGETQIAKLVMKIEVNTETKLNSRLLMVLMDSQYQPINSTTSKGFVIAKDSNQTFIIPAPIPCDLKNGNYFYRAELHYTIKGVDKFTPFETDLFTINNNRASDSAQIAENCSPDK